MQPAIYTSQGLHIAGEAGELDGRFTNQSAFVFMALLLDGTVAIWPVEENDVMVFDTIRKRDKALEELKGIEKVKGEHGI